MLEMHKNYLNYKREMSLSGIIMRQLNTMPECNCYQRAFTLNETL